jgi:ABC-type antimicrobial peptide transport system permease subunit
MLSGNMMGLLELWILNQINAVGLGWIPVSISFEVFLQSMGLSLLVGILSSLSPVLMASRLRPAEALRYE